MSKKTSRPTAPPAEIPAKHRPNTALWLGLIVFVAIIARTWNVTGLPEGFHGDEGVVGMAAQQVWRQGYTGFYSNLGGGYPTGPIYLLSVPVAIWGNTIWGVRSLSVLLGVLAVPALFGLVRAQAESRTALLAALFLATLNWHIHFSRIAFPLIIWPLIAVLAAWLVLAAARRQSAIWWALAGAGASSGIYFYNAHALFAVLLGVWVAGRLALLHDQPAAQRLGWLLAFAGGALLVAGPIIRFALDPQNGFFDHFNRDSLRATPQWQILTASGKLALLATRYIGWWDAMLWHPRAEDTVDSTMAAPVVPLSMMALVLLGVWFGWKRKNDLASLSALLLLLLPVGSVLTLGGQSRRTFAEAPFWCFLAALGALETGRWARERGIGRGVVPALAALSALAVGSNLWLYFGVQPSSQLQAAAYGADFTAATLWMRDLPPDSYIYFASDLCTLNHETRRFLVPQLRGEDRSTQFGAANGSMSEPSLEIDRAQGRPVWVLIGPYRSLLGKLQRRYPGGRVVKGRASLASPPGPTFVAYVLAE